MSYSVAKFSRRRDTYTINNTGSEMFLLSYAGFLTFCMFYTSPVMTIGETQLVILGENEKLALDLISNIDIQSTKMFLGVIVTLKY